MYLYKEFTVQAFENMKSVRLLWKISGFMSHKRSLTKFLNNILAEELADTQNSFIDK